MILVVLGIILIFIAINLKKGKNWARITQVILSSLYILFGILVLFTGNFKGLTSAIIPALIVYYLLFNQEAKQFFTRSTV